jgi:hypothetical protein
VSTASIGAGVIAVAGVTGYRWIEQGGASGFVTLAQLASTAADSGASKVGVNADAGRYSQPDLQSVLNIDMVAKVDLAAIDGTGGQSLIGTQNTGGYFSGTHSSETYLQSAGAAIALRPLASDLASTANSKGASTIGVEVGATNVEAALAAGVAGTALKAPIASPTFTGTIHAPVGTSAVVPTYAWTGSGGQYGFWLDDAAHQVLLARAGVTIFKFDNSFVHIPDTTAAVNLGPVPDISMARNPDGALYLYATPGVNCVNGFGLNHTPVGPQHVLASLTNNCIASGTTGTIPDWTNLAVYATDAQAIHDAISQLTKKVAAMELAEKAFGLLIT